MLFRCGTTISNENLDGNVTGENDMNLLISGVTIPKFSLGLLVRFAFALA
jgi:hypothetical protein